MCLIEFVPKFFIVHFVCFQFNYLYFIYFLFIATRTAVHGDIDSAAVSSLQSLCGVKTQWIVKNSYSTAHNGIRHVYLRQSHDGLEIANR